jgi:Flp pilus assembly protein TadD
VPSDARQRPSPNTFRVCTGLTAVIALIAIVIPVSKTQAVRDSQSEIREKSPDSALEDARTAERLEPYAASPKLQVALILELQGRLGLAAKTAEAATAAEATNWKTFMVLSRIEAERGRGEAAVEAYKQARSLNPRSSIFSG